MFLSHIPGTVDLLISIFLLLIFIRILMEWVGADLGNKFVFTVRKITSPYLNFFERNLSGVWRVYSFYVAIFSLIWFQYFFPYLFSAIVSFANLEGFGLHIGVGILLASLKVIGSILYFIMLMALVLFVLELVGSTYGNPFYMSLQVVLKPMLDKIYPFMPRARFDLSPVALALLCFLLRNLIDYFIGFLF